MMVICGWNGMDGGMANEVGDDGSEVGFAGYMCLVMVAKARVQKKVSWRRGKGWWVLEVWVGEEIEVAALGLTCAEEFHIKSIACLLPCTDCPRPPSSLVHSASERDRLWVLLRAGSGLREQYSFRYLGARSEMASTSAYLVKPIPGIAVSSDLSSSASSHLCRQQLGWPVRSDGQRKSFPIIKADGERNKAAPFSTSSGGPASKFVAKAIAVKGAAAASPVAAKPGHEVLLFESLREGLEEEMERDPHVFILGEDVGHYGGSYKVTKGFAEKFGDLRVLDTPIAENSFTGMAIGAAMTGLRPVVEGMNMGFLLLAYNQISNNCGMLHYTSGGQFTIPVVIRGPGGVGRQLGAEHSQRLESYFQSVPGLQMVACSTPYNAKGLMKAAIRSENPVILYEHVLLYNLKERIPDEEYICCLEKADLVRPGNDVTILTYSRMRHHVLQAAKTLINEGYDPEIIDIISLKPFDLYTIGNSIKKTHKVLIVEECMRTGGIGASLRSSIIENFWDYLDAPIMCLSSQDVPTPYAGPLEDLTVVQPPQIVTAVKQLCT